MRYFLTAIFTDDQLEDGPIITGPMGNAILYDNLDDAGDAAKALVENGTVGAQPVKGIFVQKLVPVAVYTPLQALALTRPEKEESDVQGN